MSIDLPKSTISLSREMFTSMLRLTQKRPWLQLRDEEVSDLLHLSEDNAQLTLLLKLLERIRFVYGNERQELLVGFEKHILESWLIEPSRTKIVALGDGKESDSAEAILWMLKQAWAAGDRWRPNQFISSLPIAANELVKNDDVVVFVDEFVGSGKQSCQRIRWFKEKLEERSVKVKGLYFCALARSTATAENPADYLDGYFCSLDIPRGISDCYEGDQLVEAKDAMKKLEGKLLAKKGGTLMPSFGRGGCEALYSMDDGNTPNNVLPVFWWKWLANASLRRTVLRRTGL